MSLNNPLPGPDIRNIEHDDSAKARRVLLYGKTTSSTYVPMLVDAAGKLQTSGGGTGSETDPIWNIDKVLYVPYTGSTNDLSLKSHRLDFENVGYDIPGSNSAGQKIRLYGSGIAALSDYAIGVQGSNMWFSSGGNPGGYMFYDSAGNVITTISSTGSLKTPAFISTIITGTQPYAATSTTLNTNLNADLLDGLHASSFLTGSYQPLDATLTALAGLTTAQGGLIFATGSDGFTMLAKNTSSTRYLSNTGTSNNPAWAQIDLTNGVTGDLPIGNIVSSTNRDSSHFLRGDGSWQTISASPGGSDKQIQFNSSNNFAGSSAFTWDDSEGLTINQTGVTPTFPHSHPVKVIANGTYGLWGALAISHIADSPLNFGAYIPFYWIDSNDPTSVTRVFYIGGADNNCNLVFGNESSHESLGIISGINGVPSNGGSNYTENDVLTLVGGDNNATVTASNIDETGNIGSIGLTDAGTGYTVGVYDTTGGSGTGCTVSVENVDASKIGGFKFIMASGGHFNINNLPTSTSGLVSGDLWVDTTGGLNILKIV